MQLRNDMTITELKAVLTEMKPALKAAKYLEVSNNQRNSRLFNCATFTSMAEFGTRILELSENGFKTFSIKETQLGFNVRTIKEFAPLDITEIVTGD